MTAWPVPILGALKKGETARGAETGREQATRPFIDPRMGKKIWDEPSEVAAEEGAVVVDGPDAVAVTLTPAAAEETSHRLLEGAMVAQGQDAEKRRERRSNGPSGG